MPSINGAEYLVILVVALLVFGPHRLPELTYKLGGWVREIRKVAHDFRTALEAEVGDFSQPLADLKATREGIERPLRDLTSPLPGKPVSPGGPTDAPPEGASADTGAAEPTEGVSPTSEVPAPEPDPAPEGDDVATASGGMLEWKGPVHSSGPTPDDARADFEALSSAEGDDEDAP